MKKRPVRATCRLFACLSLALVSAATARADVKLPAIFSSHMVLQRDQADPVWGWADAGEEVTVSIADQKHSAKAGGDGKWRVKLDPLKAGGPHVLTVKGKNTLTVDDVLVGEVWVCSGQSNMEWAVRSSVDNDLETLSANYPNIRHIQVPKTGTQEPQSDFKGAWEICTPENAGKFTAVGYFFARQLNQTLNVPIGLLHDSWGGSACEAWVNRDLLAADSRYKPLLERWEETEKSFDMPKLQAAYDASLAKWKIEAEAAKQAGKPAPKAPNPPGNPLTGNSRPGNLYYGMLKPVIGYGIRGVIWYQGETNAGRAYQYRDLFPLMIKSWRDEWQQGDFPFYWVQLADFKQEKPEPADSDWAELREAQTMTMSKLPNTGEAVIIDLGEGNDIHPKNKQDVAKRLARWALARDYKVNVPYHSPVYKSHETQGKKIVVTIDHAGGGLKAFDTGKPTGFAIAGKDQKFVAAEAAILPGDKVEVSSDKVAEPVAVRYAWADNPVCNLRSQNGLPVTPFRTDDWPGVTANNQK